MDHAHKQIRFPVEITLFEWSWSRNSSGFNVVGKRVGHVGEWATPNTIVNAINYNFVS
jgi:hypothetical protein